MVAGGYWHNKQVAVEGIKQSSTNYVQMLI